MAILNSADFDGNSATYSVPANDSSILYPGDVDISLSTGVTTQVVGSHRSMSSIVSLEEALQSTGFRVVGAPWAVESNANIETSRTDTDRPRIVVFDYKYKHPTLAHTSLEDLEPIVIR
eukprot:15583800-Heterocapsa_arctica.AAC.1